MLSDTDVSSLKNKRSTTSVPIRSTGIFDLRLTQKLAFLRFFFICHDSRPCFPTPLIRNAHAHTRKGLKQTARRLCFAKLVINKEKPTLRNHFFSRPIINCEII